MFKIKDFYISHSNTDVKKMWNLVKNGILDRKTVDDILSNTDGFYIFFDSEETYNKYKEFEYSSLAMEG